MITRLRNASRWRLDRLKLWRDGLFARMPASVRIHTRWPGPRRKPWQRARLTCLSYGGGVGDELMCTPVFREIRRRNPACQITFLSRFPELFAGNPNFTVQPRPSNPADIPVDALSLTYGPVHPPRRPIPSMLAECAGLILNDPHDFRPDPPKVEPSHTLRAALAIIPAPRVLIQPLGSKWAPNKNWPREHWETLIPMLTERFEVIEVGSEPLFPGDAALRFGPRFRTFAGTTSVAEFAWLISQATLFIGPVSGGMHLAAAYGVPALIVFGGYESPTGLPYSNTTPFYTPEPCAPCWLPTNCPYALKCQHKILPSTIFAAACKRIVG
jgi:ADP-heptose:LPS heptosyltransferase